HEALVSLDSYRAADDVASGRRIRARLPSPNAQRAKVTELRSRAVIPSRGSGQCARTNHVKPQLAWAGIAGPPSPTGTHGDPPARAGCARADRRATSARVRQGPAAQGTRTRRSVPDLPTPGGASRHPRTGPRLAPA